jgi:hypothetical protein
MKEKIEVQIPFTPFPEDNLSEVRKEDPSYGLSVGRAISYQWFAKSGASSDSVFYSRWVEFQKRRLYASGNQPITKYQNLLSVDGDLSHTNLDFTPVGVSEKFIDIVVNGLQDREMTIKASSQDVISADKRSKFQDEIEADMISKDFLIATQDQFGVDAFNVNPDKLPEDSEELSLFMNLNYKPSIEIAQEIAIDTVFKENQFEDTKVRIDRDLAVLGLGAGKCEFLKNDGIRVDYVDPIDVVYSPTKDPCFKDCFYYGEVKQVHINELVKINPNLTEKDLAYLSRFSDAWSAYYPIVKNYGIFSKEVVTVLYFNYKTRKNFVYKRKKTKAGGERLISKEESFVNAEPNEAFNVSSLPKDVWYEGVLILGTDMLLKWELSKNMIRPKSSKQHAVPNYVLCAPKMNDFGIIGSLQERMIPFEDQIQLTHLKLQQIKAKMIPDGVMINVDAINEINLGSGGSYGLPEAYRLFIQTGSGFYRSQNSEGEFQGGRPFEESIKSAAGQKMLALMNDYQHQMNMIRDVTGLNQATDASSPDPDSLVGLQKLAALNSNIATRHILKGSAYIVKGLAERISLRISDVLEYSDMAEEFAMKVGKYNVEVLNETKNLYLYDFGIFIELSPDEEEKQLLESNVAISLKEGKIELEDAIDIRTIKNIKLANEMLKVKRKRRAKEAQQREDVQMQMQVMANQDAQKFAAQQAIDKANAEANGKIAVKQAEGDMLIRVEEATAQLKSQLMEKEFNYNMQLKGGETQLQFDKINLQEDRKDERINRQGTQQSELIDQRQKGLPPKNFESNNDNLDNLDLSSFEP